MPDWYRYPIENISNGTTGSKLLNLLTVTSNPFPSENIYAYLPGLLIVLTFFFVVFLSLKLRGFSFLGSFAAAGIANFILVLLMYPLHILSPQIFVISLFMLPVCTLLLFIL